MIEILGIKLGANENIKRIGPGMDPKLHAQFADDFWPALKCKQESLNELMRVFVKFTDFSGLNVNYKKTKILRLGPMRFTNQELVVQQPVKWEKEIGVFGIDFSANREKMRDDNHKNLLKKSRLYWPLGL